MPTEEEGIRQVLGEPRCRARKSEQDVDRGAQVIERAVLPEGWP